MIEYSPRNSKKAACNPYRDLYIYYIQGQCGPDIEVPKKDFIGNWEEDGFSFLFFTCPANDIVDDVLNSRPDLALLDQFQMTWEEWQGQAIRPSRIGGFYISPPWDLSGDLNDPPEEKGKGIVLDPGVVFGAGTHPTTSDCLNLIELVFRENSVETVLDLGTGTGLLALAAGKLGPGRILAVDFNLLAVQTALGNIRLNGLEDRVMAVRGRAEDFIEMPADLVIANIHHDVMKHLIRSDGLLRKKFFILSGLLRSQAEEVARELSRLPVRIVEKRQSDGVWHTLFGEVCQG